MTNLVRERLVCLDEPRLEFAAGQYAIDPHDGLALYGAHSLGKAARPSFSHIVIATPEGHELWDRWATGMNRYWGPGDFDTRLWPPYLGFDVPFGSPWPTVPERRFVVNREALLDAARRSDSQERCFAVVDLFLEPIQRATKLDRLPSVAICIVPDEVKKNCRVKSRVPNPSDKDARISKEQRRSRRSGQGELFEQIPFEQYQLSPDFRRQIKARTMQHDIPVQIFQESTLRLSDDNIFGQRSLTPLCDRMWNAGTALFYKAGGKPWKLHDARPGVCYIGIAFRMVPDKKGSACCAAQMFLDSGDGIVFLGEYGPWYSPEDRQFHLSREGAKNLLQGVLETYENLKSPDSTPLQEIFLHSRSTIDHEEFAGFQDTCPPNCKLVGVRVRPDWMAPRLYRNGTRPVLRGTLWILGERSATLYCSGFKPRLATYDGSETPVPLSLNIEHGDADIEVVAKDILALTKLNYNACKLGARQPVTVGFSDAVGEILISNPNIPTRRAPFKFYI